MKMFLFICVNVYTIINYSVIIFYCVILILITLPVEFRKLSAFVKFLSAFVFLSVLRTNSLTSASSPSPGRTAVENMTREKNHEPNTQEVDAEPSYGSLCMNMNSRG